VSPVEQSDSPLGIVMNEDETANPRSLWLRLSSGISQKFPSKLSNLSDKERSIGVDVSEIDLSLRP
jgi:hypothetical protein